MSPRIVDSLLQFGHHLAQSQHGQLKGEHPFGALQVGGGFASAFELPLFGCTDVPVAPFGGKARGRVDVKGPDSHARRKATSGIPFLTPAHFGGHDGGEGESQLPLDEGGLPDEGASTGEKRGSRKHTALDELDVGQSPVGLDIAFLSGFALRPNDAGDAKEESESEEGDDDAEDEAEEEDIDDEEDDDDEDEEDSD